jgi:AhpC/TSA family
MPMRSLTFTLAAAAALAVFTPLARAGVSIGQPAPDFTLSDIDGQSHKLSDYKGKIVVLEWNNPDCPIVHKHYDSGNIPQLQKEAIADGVVWLLINSGAPGKEGADYTADQIKAWLKQRESNPTAYLRDPSGQVGHLYGAKTTPHLFVINTDGNLAYEGAIDSIRSADQADIPKATNYVRAALDSLKAGQPVAVSISRPYGCSVKY